MRAAASRELDGLERNLEFLANVGSISPYVGLLGTVWGIMISFQGLPNVREPTVATVAPALSDALNGPAIALIAAVPARRPHSHFATHAEPPLTCYEPISAYFSPYFTPRPPP